MLIDDLISFASKRPWLADELVSLSDQNLLSIDAMDICGYANNLKWDDGETFSVFLARHCFDLHMPSVRTWVEAKPHYHRKDLYKRVGCLFELRSIKEDFLSQLPPVGHFRDGQKLMIRNSLSNASHLLSISYYVSAAQTLTRTAYDSLIVLDENFVPLRFGGRAFALTIVREFAPLREGLPGISDDDLTVMCGEEAYDLMAVPLVACTLLNAKNVVLAPQKGSQKLQKKRVKKGKPPLVKMYRIEIEVPGKRFAGGVKPPAISEGTASRPLHLVRGHLADYRDGKGLFGKYKGVYYIPSHMRGDIDNGVIKKRYRVTTDKD